METPKHQFNTRVCTSLGDTAAPSPTAFVMKPPIRTLGTVPPPKVPEMGADRLRRPSSPTAGLKPIAEGIRRVPPFGSPKREGQHEQTRRSTGGVARSQIDPPQGGTGARVHRHRRWRDHSPLRLPGCMDGPASLASVPPHRMGAGWRRLRDTSAAGLADAANAGEPAYSLGPHSVRPLRRLAGGCAPSDPRNGNGAP